MITELFIKILNLSIGAVPIMAVLLVLRLIFKNAVPRKVFYMAWALVFLRLMVPFSIESDLSIFNHVPEVGVYEERTGTVVEFIKDEKEKVEFPVLLHPGNGNPNVDANDYYIPETEEPAEVVLTTVPIEKNVIFGTVWIFGTAGLLLFGIIGYFAVLKKTRFESVVYTKNVRFSEFFKTPVVCGLFRPQIILPMNFDLDDTAKVESVIAHECTHIRRKDNLWRLLASFALYVHWFNPFVWLCYDAFIRDMEVSCDEAVLAKSKEDIRTEYAKSLVSLSGKGTNPLYGGVLSFGESAIKERVKCIMNFKRATLLIVIICVAAAIALGVIFLTNPTTPHEPAEASFKLVGGENVSFDPETGLDINIMFTNTDSKTLWLSSDITLDRFDGSSGYTERFGSLYGTVMVEPGETVVFCDGVPAEYCKNEPVYGEWTISRTVYLDKELETAYGANFTFTVEEKTDFELGEKAYLSYDFSGKVLSGRIAEKFIPSNDFPTEEHLASSDTAEYYTNMIYNVCSGAGQTEVEGLTLVFQPNDKNYVIELGEYNARRLIGMIGKIEIKSTTEAVNPNTGGGIDVYLETENRIIMLHYDGRLVVFEEGVDYANVFDGEICKDVFFDIQNLAEDMISTAKEYSEKETTNNETPAGKENSEGEGSSAASPVSTDEYFKLQANLYRNSDKTYIPSEETERITGFFEAYNWTEAGDKADLGSPLEGVDVLELVRERDGKKYTFDLYEKGFVLSGSAVKEEYNKKAWLCENGAWDHLIADINDEYSDSNAFYPYWFGLANIKNISVVSVKDMHRSGNEVVGEANNYFTQEDSCMEEFVNRLRRISITESEKISNTTREELIEKEDKYLYVLIMFENGTSYEVYFTKTEILIASSGVTYNLKHTAAEGIDPYDDFLDFAEEGGPANPVTGKPVIYLYPEKETKVTVNLEFDGKLTYTYPALNDGWKVIAQPDGTLTNLADNSTHYYLFWEGTANPEWTYEKGFVIKGSETEAFLKETLAKMGLTPREYNDFITYWVPQMQENPYNLISFSGEEYSEIAKLKVDPKPDSVLRVHMMWKALENPVDIEPQEIKGFERKGFTLVEWGGTKLD
ncbi:MAG: M56 family metallopeptidase [Oscillospiraceae bacterium]|nr:M56 family metallopeptidase [Oscillospiraceae bacterium]